MVPSIEYTFTLQDRWSRKLFMALCRRYSLKPYRYARQRYTTVIVYQKLLLMMCCALHKELVAYLEQATEKIISEKVYGDTTEAQEVMQMIEVG